MPQGSDDWRRTMLVHGAKRLRAMQRCLVKPQFSKEGKEVLARMIPQQMTLNERLLRAMTFKDSERQ